ncbi:MAG: methionine--tRNA ligase [Phycisphaerae bacterium]|nr:methionine--tRNA ligase [Phycisphaerae bacterium]
MTQTPATDQTNTPAHANDHAPCYITTPIYYVNDRPHIGHCYTTLVADVLARAQRLLGRDVFFLTGTDEHAEKVVKAAADNGMSPMDWATKNAERFKDAFTFMGFSNDDFVRTTEDRHKTRASAYIKKLKDADIIYKGEYKGWYDPSQEEYVTETTAKENDFKSPVTGKPLEERTEENYFFRLSNYETWLKATINSGELKILPEARKNEVLGRIAQGLNDVPVSRRIKQGDPDWGVVMPDDPEHRVYVWIEALCNYLTTVDTEDRRKYWPQRSADDAHPAPTITHLMAKDILWFHAVIWPAMLHALGETIPSTVYAHAYWIAEGRKMSKSLGNFIEIDTLRAYAARYHLDAVRWFLTTQGPLGPTDADFAHARFVEVYNADLANGIGNATSRVSNMIEKYLGGEIERTCDGRFGFEEGVALQTARAARAAAGNPVDDDSRVFDLRSSCEEALRKAEASLANDCITDTLTAGKALSDEVDAFIAYAAPFTLAKRLDEFEHGQRALATILYASAEALRIASLLLAPAMPFQMAELWRRWNCNHLTLPDDPNSPFVAPLEHLAHWAGDFGLKPGQRIAKGDPLFMRADPAEPAPSAN